MENLADISEFQTSFE